MSPATAKAASHMEAARLPDWKLAYRVDEACAATGYGKTKMWELIWAGKIVAKKDNGITIIPRVELQRYIDNLPDSEPRQREP